MPYSSPRPPQSPRPCPPRRLPQPPPAAEAAAEAAQDRVFALLALALWGGTAWRMAPLVTWSDNLQSLAGIAAIFCVSLAWPSLAPCSYATWRAPALSALRLGLLALPFNYQGYIFDAICGVGDATGAAVHAFHLLMGTHCALLIFSSLGWRLPLPAHLGVQTAAVAMLAGWGMHPHLQSQLLSSPQTRSMVASLHSAASFLSGMLVPSAVLKPPDDLYQQAAAALLWLWLVVGWLTPTLLLMLPGLARRAVAEQRPRSSPRNSTAAAAPSAEYAPGWLPAAAVERLLLGLIEPPPPSQQDVAGIQLRLKQAGVLWLRWAALLLGSWLLCSAVAPLWSAPAAALATDA